MTINIFDQFTADDLDTLESLIAEHGDYVRSGGHVTFGRIVEALEDAREERQREQEEAERAEAPEGVYADTTLNADQAQAAAYFLLGVARRGGTVTVSEVATEIF